MLGFYLLILISSHHSHIMTTQIAWSLLPCIPFMVMNIALNKRASFIYNEHRQIMCKKQRIQNKVCKLRKERATKDWLDLAIALPMQKQLFRLSVVGRDLLKCGIIMKKYSLHHAECFIGASTYYSELTRGIGCKDQAC